VEEEQFGVAAGVVREVRVGGEMLRCGLEGFGGGHESVVNGGSLVRSAEG